MSDQNPTPVTAPVALQPVPPAASPAITTPTPEPTELEREVDQLASEVNQQRVRLDGSKEAMRAKLEAYLKTEGAELVKPEPLVEGLLELASEVNDTVLSLLSDTLRVVRKAVTPEDFDDEELGDEDEDEMPSMLFEEDAESILSCLKQYQTMLQQTVPVTAEGERKRAIEMLLFEAKQVVELVESITVNESEETDAGDDSATS